MKTFLLAFLQTLKSNAVKTLCVLQLNFAAINSLVKIVLPYCSEHITISVRTQTKTLNCEQLYNLILQVMWNLNIELIIEIR